MRGRWCSAHVHIARNIQIRKHSHLMDSLRTTNDLFHRPTFTHVQSPPIGLRCKTSLKWLKCSIYQWCRLRHLRTRPVWDRNNRSWSWSCRSGVVLWNTVLLYARRHNDLEGHSNFSSTIYSFSILCLEHHYCADQQYSVHLLKS